MDEEYYTPEEVAQHFKVKKPTVYKWMREGKLAYVIIGSDRRITGTALREFVKPGRPEEVIGQETEPGQRRPTRLAA